MSLFSEYFEGLVDNYQLSCLKDGEIKGLRINKAGREAELTLLLFELVPYSEISAAENSIKEKLMMKKFVIKPRYMSELFEPAYFDSIIKFVRRKSTAANGFFEGACAELDDNGVLKITLKKGGLDVLENLGVDKEIEDTVLDMFGLGVKVKFIQTEEYDIEKEVAQAVREKENQENAKREENAKSTKHELMNGLPLYSDTVKTVFGSPTRSKPQPISELTADSGKVTIWGDIIKRDGRVSKNGVYKTLSFSISDYTSSVFVRLFDRKEAVERIEKKMEKVNTVIVKGNYGYDKYESEYIITPDCIQSVVKAEKEDNAAEKRVELHLHTSYSEMDGIAAPTALIERAIKWGHKAIAVTDHGVVQALPEAYKAAKGKIKLLLGMEGYLVDDEAYPNFMDLKNTQFKRYHIILLVKEDTSFDTSIPKEERKYGRKNLYELISSSSINTFKSRPLIPKSLLAKKRDGLIIGSACEQGELYQAILEEKSDEELEKIASFYDYLEIQPNGNNAFMLRTSSDEYIINKKGEERKNIHWRVNTEEDLININKKIIALGDKLGKLTVATGDVHFLDENDAIFRSIIMASKGYEDADMQAPLYFKTTDEMLADFAWAGDRAREFVIDNPNKIADMIMDDIPPIPPGTFQPHIDGANEELTEKCWSRAKELYGDPVPEYVAQRLERELDSIITHGFGVLYVIAKRLVEESEKNGYLVGSRGSVGSSLVAHLSGISEVNPLSPHYYCKNCKHSEFFTHGEVGSGFDLPPKNCPVCGNPMKRDGHEIPFETFLGFDGDKEPDIDLNFSGEYQSRSHRFTEELFGKNYVFKAGTMSTVADKTAYGYVMKYLEERGLTNQKSKAEIDRLAMGCTGIKRTTGQHPGGMVVVPDEYTVEDFTPIQYPSNDKTKGTYTTHFDFKKSLHDTLLKLDELGHDNPTLYKYLEDSTGIPVMDVDLCDPQIYKLITSTEPIGVSPDDIDCNTGTLAIPEMGTPFVIGMLEEAQPKNFADLLQISGLSHGTDVWLGNARELIQNKTCTISEVIGCRDDIMTYLIHKAEKYESETGKPSPLSKIDCFNIMEITRKGMAAEKLPPYEKAMKTVGVEQWYIDSCYKIKYMFPKAHAAAYVIAALRLAWYKIYHPLEFYSAYFTVRGEAIDADAAVAGHDAVKRKMKEISEKDDKEEKTDKDEGTYVVLQVIIEMLARGIEFLPVDLYKSDWRIYRIENGKIRLPFLAIKGIGQNAAKAIYDAVNDGNGDFLSCDDLMARAHIGSAVVQALRECGALGDLPESNQISLFGF